MRSLVEMSQNALRRRSSAGVATVAVAALFAVTAPPALAHYTYDYHGTDLGSVNSSHTASSACDREDDGHMFYVEARLSNGKTARIEDKYGAGCSTEYFNFAPIASFRVCEESVSCRPWKKA